MAATHYAFFSMLLMVCYGQRSPYAGRDPIGYPRIEVPTSTTTVNPLGNRFGENQTTTTTTTQRLPLEALGDRELVNRLGQLPQDKQPFWFLNWQELEKHRTRPHTFDQKPNIFNSQVQQQLNNINNFDNQVLPQQQNAFNNQAVQRPQNNFNNEAVSQQRNNFNQRVPQQVVRSNRF